MTTPHGPPNDGQPNAGPPNDGQPHAGQPHAGHDPSARPPGRHRGFSLRRAAAADPPPDPGLARERTSLAWTRTAISFAAVGGVVLKRDVIPGLILLAVAPAIWLLGRLAYRRQDRLILLTGTVVAVAVVALVVSLTG